MQLGSCAFRAHTAQKWALHSCTSNGGAGRRRIRDRQAIAQVHVQRTEACTQRRASRPANGLEAASRRQLLLSAAAAAVVGLVSGPGPARADIVYDAVRSAVRPQTDDETAVVTLLDARGTLMELKALAATPADSQERFRARRILPGMAKRLRELGPSVPELVALVQGSGDGEAQLSREYGGTGGDGFQGGAVPLYIAIGNIVTISGRTIKEQAQASPKFAADAVSRIDKLLAALPQELVARAKEFRTRRMATA